MNELFNLPRVGFRAIAVWRRNALVWAKGAMWSSLLGDLFEPIIYLFGLGYGLGAFVNMMDGTSYVHYVAPGLLAQGVMYSASFENTYASFTRMERQKTYTAIMVTPVNLEEVVAGDIYWGATKATIGGVMITIVASIMGLTTLPQAILCIPLAFLIGLTFSSIALTVAALAPNYDFFTYYFTIILTPVLLVSGAWFPLARLPESLQMVSEVLPLTHAVRAARALMMGPITPQILPSLVWIALWCFVFFTLATNLIRRRLVV